MSAKMGRPKSPNPKVIDLKVRLDAKTNEKLLSYCEKHNLTRAEVLRKGFTELLENKAKEAAPNHQKNRFLP